MNSMRLLILMTFILYETQCAPTIETLKMLKLLVSKHLQPITEQPILEEEIFPTYNCEPVEDGAVDDAAIEWNRQVFLVNEKPILIEVGNIEPIPNVYQNENLNVNPEKNSELSFEQIADLSPEVNCEENPSVSVEEEHKNEYEKDLNTQWLLGENTSERLPEIDVGVGPIPIRDKIRNKINIIKSKLRLKNRLQIPVMESIEETKNNLGVTTVEPITSVEPVTTGNPITTLKPPTAAVQYITTVQPVTTAQPITTGQPITTAQPATTAQYTSTLKSVNYTPDVQVNVAAIDSQQPIVNIPPIEYQMPWEPQQVYYSDSPYYQWINNCPPSVSPQICFQQNPYYLSNPIYSDTLNSNPLTLENVPYNIPNNQNQKSNNGMTKVINYINIDAAQPVNPIKPNQDEPWIRYAYDNLKPIDPNPISSYYVPQTDKPVPQAEIVYPNSNVVYSTSTMEPIAVYADDRILTVVNQGEKTQPRYNLDPVLGPTPQSTNVQSSEYPLRGDIPFGDDVNPNINYDQPEGDVSKYTLKERRHVVDNSNVKKLVSQENNPKMQIPVSEISLDKPVFEPAEADTPINEIEIPAITEIKIPITKTGTPAITKIEKPVVKTGTSTVDKIEIPAVTVTEIPHPISNNVKLGI